MPLRVILTNSSRLVLRQSNLRNIRKMCDSKPAINVLDEIVQKNDRKVTKTVQTQHSIRETGDNILIFKDELLKNCDNVDGVWRIEELVENTHEKSEENPPVCIPESKSQESDSKRKPSNDSRSPKKKRLKSDFINKDRPGFTEDRYDETSYYFENGLRKVYPYFFTFTTFTKGRWVGEKILDVFMREFRAHPVEEYEKAIRLGSLTVNDEKVPADYKLQHNDFLSNTVHRHEIPVVAQSIEIIHLDDDVCIVNKPASIPVHPCGRYRHNTVVFILAKEYNLRNLKPIHRLDRLTSGLLLLGRNINKSREMQRHIDQREVEKEYVCCVEGRFPDSPITCDAPIEAISHKIGVCKVSPPGSDKGKECKTIFELLRYNAKSNTSIVICKPRTGRMHQIRVHLQYLGYPIINDPLYNDDVFGPSKGKGGDFGGKTDDELIQQLIEIHNAENFLGLEGESHRVVSKSIKKLKNNCKTSYPDIALPNSSNEKSCQTSFEQPDTTFDASKMTSDENCPECKVIYKDPNPEQLVMYLHALKYKGPNWYYETPLPYWVDENFEIE